MTIDELKAEALRLAPESRADLARELLASLDSLSESEIERLSLDEADRRLAQLDRGEASADPSDVVLARVRARKGRVSRSMSTRALRPRSRCSPSPTRSDGRSTGRLACSGAEVRRCGGASAFLCKAADVDGSALVGQLGWPFLVSMIIMPLWKP